MARSLNVEVDATCIGSAYCRGSAPEVFLEGPERQTVVATNPVQDSPEVQEAMESCPVEAISATDAQTGDEVFP
ncbi:ferredoxin [Rhodococcus sp. X156]|uniref:ferredoxin n=1 Tax=Rhodococcus sp. X156 TaxID=2499145 RepID=UPI000FD87F3A|nr:ferredoxin [Rhodococcus sp. X156]